MHNKLALSALLTVAVAAVAAMLQLPVPALQAGGPTAPTFSITTLNGETIGLPGPGDKPLLLYFMATGCTDCALEAADLARLNAEYGERAPTILAVDVMPDTADSLRQWIAALPAAGLSYHWAIDSAGTLTKAFRVSALDTTIAIRPGGTISFRSDRLLSYDALRPVVEAMLS